MDPFGATYATMNAISGAAMLVLVAVVLAGRGDILTRALLSAVLVVSAAISVIAALRYVTTDAFVRANVEFYVSLGALLLPIVYLAFLGAGLRSRFVRPLRIRAVQAGLLVSACAVVSAALAFPDVAWALIHPAAPLVGALAICAFLFATLAALEQYLRAPLGTVAKRQGGAYLAAFLFHDAAWLAAYAGVLLPHGGTRDVLQQVVAPVLGVVFSFLLARALLRFHVFDFDLRVKRSLRRSIVTAVFVVLVIAATQIVENVSNDTFGLVGGALAAGVALFALRPIERVAARIADGAMPSVHDTEEYRLVRKRDVYRAAWESALADGIVTDKERRVLATLQDKLGLTALDALAAEEEARAAVPPRADEAVPGAV